MSAKKTRDKRRVVWTVLPRTEMDPVREIKNNQMDAIDFHDPDWVEKAWMREETSGFCKLTARERRDDDGVESLETDRPDKLCDPAGSALGILPEEGGIEAAPVMRENHEYTLSFRLWI
jgi:hypothetical protein